MKFTSIILRPFFNYSSATLRLCGLVATLAISILAQSLAVEKVKPRSWWVGSTINSVRVRVRGTNFAGDKRHFRSNEKSIEKKG